MRHLRASLVFVVLWMGGCPSAGISDVACTVDAECPPGSYCPSDGVTAARCVAGVDPSQQFDAGAPADAGQSQDAGEPADSGEDNDAGRRGDAGHHDAGEPVDAGAPDAGEGVDAGGSPDAGEPQDAGESPDAGHRRDAGEAPDAGQAVDAGAPSDAGEAIDAGPPVDAGMSSGACTTVAMCAANGREACIAGACLPDPTWTQGPVPPDNPPNTEYTSNGNGTVTDNTTGLIWQQPMASTMHTWSDAESYCAGLSLGAYPSGWRLPSVAEAQSLIIVGGDGPTINTHAFPNTQSAAIWTTTPDPSISGEAWVVDFTFATTYSQDETASTEDARCVVSLVNGLPSPVGDASPVDGSAPPGRYTFPDGTVSSSNTVYDTVTELTWERSPPATTHSYADAVVYCTALNTGGIATWRLPTTKELASLVDYGLYDPAIDRTAFPGTLSQNYWSTAPQAGAGGFVGFDSGEINSDFDVSGDAYYVRCVH